MQSTEDLERKVARLTDVIVVNAGLFETRANRARLQEKIDRDMELSSAKYWKARAEVYEIVAYTLRSDLKASGGQATAVSHTTQRVTVDSLRHELEIAKAFHKTAVQQRDAAWAEVDTLREERVKLIDACQEYRAKLDVLQTK
jgi:hypothetical protein